MSTTIDTRQNPITAAIKIAGIGKKGSQNLPKELILEIETQWNNPLINPASKGALLGGLLMKGLTTEEQDLLNALGLDNSNPASLIESISPEAPSAIKNIYIKLLNKEELSLAKAQTLGDFLFSSLPGDILRGLAASILRVRYETADEYEGLLKSAQKTFSPPFLKAPTPNAPIIQLAEPFDGVDHSTMITPLLADYLASQGFIPVSLVGRNSGPKMIMNLKDIAVKINGCFIKNPSDLNNSLPDYGYYLDQADLSIAIDRWVDIRRVIIKRPFMATIERFLNPLHADILIASAFHPPYGEKMMTLAERAGFKGAIIIRNGIEGTTAFALLRSSKILASVQLADKKFLRKEFDFDSQRILGHTVSVEEKIEFPSADRNAALINQFKKEGQTGNILFNLRVKATCQGIQQAIDWITHQRRSE